MPEWLGEARQLHGLILCYPQPLQDPIPISSLQCPAAVGYGEMLPMTERGENGEQATNTIPQCSAAAQVPVWLLILVFPLVLSWSPVHPYILNSQEKAIPCCSCTAVQKGSTLENLLASEIIVIMV